MQTYVFTVAVTGPDVQDLTEALRDRLITDDGTIPDEVDVSDGYRRRAGHRVMGAWLLKRHKARSQYVCDAHKCPCVDGVGRGRAGARRAPNPSRASR